MRRGAAAALILAALAVPAASSLAAPADKYIEVVRETKDCGDGACFIEYLYLSNGIAIKKQFYSTDYDKTPVMSIRQAQEPQVQALLEQAARLFPDGKSRGNTARDNNNVYFFDGKALYTISTPVQPTPEFLALFDAAGRAYDKTAVSPDFYLHEYFAKAKEGMEDFHLFSDGSGIFNTVSLPDYNVVSSRTFHVGADDVAGIRKLAAAALKEEGQKRKQCAAGTGLDYGFVEAQMDGAYLRSYPCGDEGNAFAALFANVRRLKPD